MKKLLIILMGLMVAGSIYSNEEDTCTGDDCPIGDWAGGGGGF